MVPPLCAYRAQLHRLEFIRAIGGVDYINDSKATNLDALEKALLSATKPIVLIAGGKDKGFAFDSIAPLVARKVRHAVLIGEIAPRVARRLARGDGMRARLIVRRGRRARPGRRPAKAKPFSFPPALPPSTCSRATPIAATNSAPSCAAYPTQHHENAIHHEAKETPAPRLPAARARSGCPTEWTTSRWRSRT